MRVQGRERRSAADWSALIERQGASRLSQRDFCQAEGLAVSTFTYWKRKLSGGVVAKANSKLKTPLFTPISEPTGSDEGRQQDDVGPGGWAIDLDLGDGLRLSIRKVA